MPLCPSCRGRLSLSEVFGGGGIVCPHCGSELEPIRWASLTTVIFVILAVQVGVHVAQALGLNFPIQLVIGGVGGALMGGALNIFVVRYRMKPPKGPVLKL